MTSLHLARVYEGVVSWWGPRLGLGLQKKAQAVSRTPVVHLEPVVWCLWDPDTLCVARALASISTSPGKSFWMKKQLAAISRGGLGLVEEGRESGGTGVPEGLWGSRWWRPWEKEAGVACDHPEGKRSLSRAPAGGRGRVYPAAPQMPAQS